MINSLQFIFQRIHSRGITFRDDKVTGGKSFGYHSYPLFSLRTKGERETEKKLALTWMGNNPNILSINYGEGHLWFARAERHNNGSISWSERVI